VTAVATSRYASATVGSTAARRSKLGCDVRWLRDSHLDTQRSREHGYQHRARPVPAHGVHATPCDVTTQARATPTRLGDIAGNLAGWSAPNATTVRSGQRAGPWEGRGSWSG